MATPQPDVAAAGGATGAEALPLCDREQTHRVKHFLVYGDFGSKKSTFASTCPLPQLVFAFDSYDKLDPYFRNGRVTEGLNPWGTPVFYVWHLKEEKIIRVVEHYVDVDPYKPDCYTRYIRRMQVEPTKFTDAEARRYGTVVWDSATFFGMARRKLDQFVTNATTKSGAQQDGKQWYGAASSVSEDELIRRAIMIPTNAVVIAHVDDSIENVNGQAIQMPALSGKQNRRKGPAGFGEVYHAHVTGRGAARQWRLQTEPDELFAATTMIPAPDGCEPSYSALWTNSK